jgi:hypothetical protein
MKTTDYLMLFMPFNPCSVLITILRLSLFSAMFSSTEAPGKSVQTARSTYVLFIAVDDLPPIPGCYGCQNVI